MLVNNIVCDKCGAIHKETNHWFVVNVYKTSYITILPMSGQLKNLKVWKYHICGQECLASIYQEWLDSCYPLNITDPGEDNDIPL